jgi:hypothetical protein
MVLAISEWLTGRREVGGLVGFFHVNRWSPTNVALVAFAVAIGGISSNLLATMIADGGWTGTFVRYPLKAGIYLFLVLGSAVVTTIVVVR